MRAKFAFERGFIGPIGDDLPSLVPIVVALLLFFSIFALTLNTYNAKNDDLRKETEMTSVARELKGDSLILDVNSFMQKCSSIQLKKYPYNFMIAVYSTNVDMKNVTSDFAAASENNGELNFVASDETGFLKQPLDNSTKGAYFCSYQMVGGKSFTAAKKDFLLRFYPVAVQYPKTVSTGATHYLIVPALMAMVFWE